MKLTKTLRVVTLFIMTFLTVAVAQEHDAEAAPSCTGDLCTGVTIQRVQAQDNGTVWIYTDATETDSAGCSSGDHWVIDDLSDGAANATKLVLAALLAALKVRVNVDANCIVDYIGVEAA